jgi:hypothetical protein
MKHIKSFLCCGLSLLFVLSANAQDDPIQNGFGVGFGQGFKLIGRTDSRGMEYIPIERDKSLRTLTNDIDDVILIKIKNDQRAKVSMILKDKTDLDEQFIYTFNHRRNGSRSIHQDYIALNYNYIPSTPEDGIKFIKSDSIKDYILYGTLVGGGLGIIVGITYIASNQDNYQGSFGGIGEFGDFIRIVGIGAFIGAIGGLIVGLLNQEDVIAINHN